MPALPQLVPVGISTVQGVCQHTRHVDAPADVYFWAKGREWEWVCLLGHFVVGIYFQGESSFVLLARWNDDHVARRGERESIVVGALLARRRRNSSEVSWSSTQNHSTWWSGFASRAKPLGILILFFFSTRDVGCIMPH